MSKASVKAEIDRKKAYVATKREEVKLWRSRKTGSKDKSYKAYCDSQIRMKQSDIANRMAEIARLRERMKYEK
nr:hypothetical protein [Bacteroides sp.]